MVRNAGQQRESSGVRPSEPDRPPTPGGPPALPTRVAARVLAVQACLALVVGLTFLACYAGLQRDPQPRHLPVAVSVEAAGPVAAALGPLARVTPVADDAAARRVVRNGDEVAALVTQPDRSANVYVAGPNGLAENGAAEQVLRTVAQRGGATVHVVDLLPTVPFDPRGLASFYVALAATVGSFILAQAMFGVRQLVRLRAQVLTLAAFAVVVGVSLAVLAGPVLHVVPEGVAPLAAVLVLLSLAVALGSRALVAWFGPVGITLATLAMTAVGLSTSGGILGQHLLPVPLGALGALLPPGAGLRALVSLGYFSGRHAALPLVTLAAWALVGLGALLLHARRRATR